MKQFARILFVGALLLVGALSAHAQNEWVKKERYGGGKRERAVGFSVGNKGYFTCGQDTANDMRKDTWEFDPGANTWTQKADFGGVARRNAGAFTVGNIGYVGTGMSKAESFLGVKLADFWAYDPTVNAWSQIASIPENNGQGIYFCTAFSIDSHGYVCCGKKGPDNYSNNLWQYKPSVDAWVQRSDFPGVRYAQASFVVGNKGYVGTGTDEDAYVTEMYSYDPGSDTWAPIADFPGVARNGATGFGIDNLGYLGLGADGGYRDDVWAYDPLSDTWATRAVYKGDGRRYAAAFVVGSRAYVGTGKGASGVRRNFYEYAPAIPNSVSEIDDAIALLTYPNPMVEQAYITIQHPTKYANVEVQLFDQNGKLVSSDFDWDGTGVLIQRNGLPAGNYICRLIDRDESTLIGTQKLTLR
jgi:N-acetylneuraminic acid mutarotase